MNKDCSMCSVMSQFRENFQMYNLEVVANMNYLVDSTSPLHFILHLLYHISI